MTGQNPQHNQHIIEQANILDAAFAEHNQQVMLMLRDFARRLDKIEADVEALKQQVDTSGKNNPSTPLAADVFITSQSLKQVKRDLWRALN